MKRREIDEGAPDSLLAVTTEFAPWLFVVAPLAIVALALALAWAIPTVVIGVAAWVIWKVTLPQGVRESGWE